MWPTLDFLISSKKVWRISWDRCRAAACRRAGAWSVPERSVSGAIHTIRTLRPLLMNGTPASDGPTERRTLLPARLLSRKEWANSFSGNHPHFRPRSGSLNLGTIWIRRGRPEQTPPIRPLAPTPRRDEEPFWPGPSFEVDGDTCRDSNKHPH